MSKIVIIILILFSSCYSQKLIFKNIDTYSNKSIHSLIFIRGNSFIGDSVIRTPAEKRIRVEKHEYDILKKFITKNIITNSKETINVDSFGSFQVLSRGLFLKSSYILSNAEISTAYYNDLIKYLEDNNINRLGRDFKIILVLLKQDIPSVRR